MATTMQETRFNRHRTGALAVFLMYASLAGLYIAVGTAVLIFQKYWRDFPMSMKTAFGVLCILYGFFRLYRAYGNYQGKQTDLE